MLKSVLKSQLWPSVNGPRGSAIWQWIERQQPFKCEVFSAYLKEFQSPCQELQQLTVQLKILVDGLLFPLPEKGEPLRDSHRWTS